MKDEFASFRHDFSMKNRFTCQGANLRKPGCEFDGAIRAVAGGGESKRPEFVRKGLRPAQGMRSDGRKKISLNRIIILVADEKALYLSNKVDCESICKYDFPRGEFYA